MEFDWAQAGPTMLASFLASLVECVEALTIVLAAGAVRGWRSALTGCGAALAVLLLLVALLGAALARTPLGRVQTVVGTLLLLFGLRWLRKAILRASGLMPLHDEAAAFRKSTERLGSPVAAGWDSVAMAATFQITMLEGTEVVFIVIAIGAGGTGLLLPAGLGALAALVVIAALGVALHRPLAKVPENLLKFVVGVLLSAFGTFWVGEGLGLGWPGGDWSVPGLVLGYLLVALFTTGLCKRRGRAFEGAV
jgi:uncharacterized membrane protein